MSRRNCDGTQLWCPISVADRLVCDEIKVAVGLDSDPNLIRSALYHYAVHVLGAGSVRTESFRLRQKNGVPRKKGRPAFQPRKDAPSATF